MNDEHEIRRIVAKARTLTEKIPANYADDCIKEGLSVDQVGSRLFDIVTYRAATNPNEIYSKRAENRALGNGRHHERGHRRNVTEARREAIF